MDTPRNCRSYGSRGAGTVLKATLGLLILAASYLGCLLFGLPWWWLAWSNDETMIWQDFVFLVPILGVITIAVLVGAVATGYAIGNAILGD